MCIRDRGSDGLHRRRGRGRAPERRRLRRDHRPAHAAALGQAGGAGERGQDLEIVDYARGHAHLGLRRRDRGAGGRGRLRAARCPDQAHRGARHPDSLLAGAREGLHPAGRGRGRRTAGAGRVLMATQTQIEVVMPQMGVSVSEGTIVKWLKSEGQQVAADEPLLEISTDKVDTEVPSPADGVLGSIVTLEGETVAVGTTIALITTVGEALAEPEPVSTAIGSGAPDPPEPVAAQLTEPADRTFVSPVVARIAAEHSVDLERVSGSGHGGRVTKKDVLAHIAAATTSEPETVTSKPLPAPVTSSAPSNGDRLEPMSQMRRSIAEHMRRSLDTCLLYTSPSPRDRTRSRM